MDLRTVDELLTTTRSVRARLDLTRPVDRELIVPSTPSIRQIASPNEGRRKREMLLFLVSGRVDALSGRFIRAQDNEEELVRRTDEIRRDDLHTVTLRA